MKSVKTVLFLLLIHNVNHNDKHLIRSKISTQNTLFVKENWWRIDEKKNESRKEKKNVFTNSLKKNEI